MATVDREAVQRQVNGITANLSALGQNLIQVTALRTAAGDQAANDIRAARARLIAQRDVLFKVLNGSELSASDRAVLATGEYVGSAVAALPNAIAAVPSAIGRGLIAGAWPYLLAGAVYLWWTGKAGRSSGTWH